MIFIVIFILLFGLIYSLSVTYFTLRQPSISKTRIDIGDFNQFKEDWHRLLNQYVPFYQALSHANQLTFQDKMLQFLKRVEIFPLDFEITDKDYLFVASSAVLPVFLKDDWLYPSLKMVILHQYPLGVFEDRHGNELQTAGMFDFKRSPDKIHIVREILWKDFLHDTPCNVALHEFVHCIDYADQRIDGIPAILMEKRYVEPWMNQMLLEMKNLFHPQSKINWYAGENKPEFLATVFEYYFKQPYHFQQHHPELFKILQRILNHDEEE